MSPKAAFMVKRFLLACGVSEGELDSEFEFDPDDYEGAALEVQVSQENYEGVLRNKVKGFVSTEVDDEPVRKSGKIAGTKKGPKVR
jgi:hypothetical protein